MNNIDFLSADHYRVFKQLARQLEDPGAAGKEYFSALYVIAGNERVRDILLPYINLETGRINTSTIIEDNTFEKGEIVLVKLVIHLYNHKEWVLPTELISLPQEDYQLAMQAITLCRDDQFDGIVIPTADETETRGK
ncbi:hypothetical protein A6395_05680 [Exiguobacterium sp. SH31]|uniref:hypothetical protein n=1 Tax=unclassified Exiguobacterium TaxID=2644629 RepID=UPI0008B357C8|nr:MULTISPECIES: hypothetical protein [unclassified Exiguobacterium]OGX79614.1 hypothetical protein A6395_05680 [Exiguobacterium sp. SH31]TCI57475.1 hypothetical protein EVJ24_01480 [Exiguobacterium sp. SH1S21]TCI71117.1 hypothetical protein EVJ22_07430 [Exiguobacterium sp. SH0S7]